MEKAAPLSHPGLCKEEKKKKKSAIVKTGQTIISVMNQTLNLYGSDIARGHHCNSTWTVEKQLCSAHFQHYLM